MSKQGSSMKYILKLSALGAICLHTFAATQENKIFTSKPDCINLNLKNAYNRFKAFDLKNQSQKQDYAFFKNACHESLQEFKESNSGKFAKRVVAQQQPGYDLPVTRRMIADQVNAAWQRESQLQTEIKNIHQNYNSWTTIAAKTSMTFAFIGGYALINPFLPSCMQFKAESLKLVAPAAGVIAGLNGAMLWKKKNAQDHVLAQMKPELHEVFHAAYNGNELLKIVDSIAAKK
jgi:hypothetical protein